MLVNMLDAKTQLSKLVDAALRGEDVVIANRGKPMVRLVRAEAKKPKRQLGSLQGLWSEAELDAAFSPAADADVAADLAFQLQRRELRVMEPAPRFEPAAAPKAPAKKAQKPKAPKR